MIFNSQTKKSSEISEQERKIYTGIVLHEDGSKEYLLNGQHHRTDGPAVEWVNGTKFWYLYDKRHRTDGPAIEWFNGTKFWYYQDQHLEVNSQEEFESWLKVLAFE